MQKEVATKHAEEIARRLMSNGAGQLADRLALQVKSTGANGIEPINDLGRRSITSVIGVIREYLIQEVAKPCKKK